MKRQTSEWEKIFSYKAPDKGFISKMYKPLMHLNISKKKKKDPNKKWTDVISSYFSNEDMQVAKKGHEKMFNITSY